MEPWKKYIKDFCEQNCPSLLEERNFFKEMAEKAVKEGKSDEVCAEFLDDVLDDIRNNREPKDLEAFVEYVGDEELVKDVIKNQLELDIFRDKLRRIMNGEYFLPEGNNKA